MEGLTIGSLRKAVKDGDVENGSFMAGQISGLIKEIKPVEDIIKEMFTSAEELLNKKISLY
jgi:enoyl-[acyl-carrier protein] reductase II